MQHETSIHELSGGSKLLAVHVPGAISSYIRTSVRAGYRFCDAKVYEVPHLLEHMAFEGTKQYPEPLIFKTAIERLGARYNATTGVDSVNYFFNGGDSDLMTLVDLNLTQVLEPLFMPERVEQQKEVIVTELSRKIDNDGINRGYRNYRRIFDSINPPYEDRVDIVKTITVEDIQKFYTHAYGSANLRYIAAGDFGKNTLELLQSKLNMALAGRPRGVRHEFVPLEPTKFGRTVDIYPSHIPTQQHFLIRWADPGYHLADREALYVLAVIYGVGLGSRVNMKARERGLAYGFSTGGGTDYDLTDFVAAAQVPPDKLRPLIELVLAELADIRAGNFSEEEYQRAIGMIVGQTKLGLQTPQAIAGGYAGYFLRDEPLETPEESLAKVEATTRKDIVRVAQKYLRADNWVFTLIGQGLESKEDEFRAMVDKHFK